MKVEQEQFNHVFHSRENAALNAVLDRLNDTLSRGPTGRPREQSLPKCGSLDPTEFRTWKGQITQLIVLNQWEAPSPDDAADVQAADLERCRRGIVATRAVLEGDLAATSEHLDLDAYDTVEGYLDALTLLVITPAGQQLAEEEFKAVRQAAGESILRFAARVRSKYRKAFPDEDHETARMAKRQLLAGLASRGLGQTVARQTPLDRVTFTEMINTIQQVHAADLMMLSIHHSSQQGVNALKGGQKKKGGQGTNQQPHQGAGGKGPGADGVLRNRRGEVIECYTCQRNHLQKDCPQKAPGGAPAAGRGQGGRGRGGRGRGGQRPGHSQPRGVNQIEGGQEEGEYDEGPGQGEGVWGDLEGEAFPGQGNC